MVNGCGRCHGVCQPAVESKRRFTPSSLVAQKMLLQTVFNVLMVRPSSNHLAETSQNQSMSGVALRTIKMNAHLPNGQGSSCNAALPSPPGAGKDMLHYKRSPRAARSPGHGSSCHWLCASSVAASAHKSDIDGKGKPVRLIYEASNSSFGLSRFVTHFLARNIRSEVFWSTSDHRSLCQTSIKREVRCTKASDQNSESNHLRELTVRITCRFSAGNNGMTPININHPLFFPLRDPRTVHSQNPDSVISSSKMVQFFHATARDSKTLHANHKVAIHGEAFES